MPDIKRHSRAGGGKGSDEEDAVGDPDFSEKFFHESVGEARGSFCW
jgi:hypothetical protein